MTWSQTSENSGAGRFKALVSLGQSLAADIAAMLFSMDLLHLWMLTTNPWNSAMPCRIKVTFKQTQQPDLWSCCLTMHHGFLDVSLLAKAFESSFVLETDRRESWINYWYLNYSCSAHQSDVKVSYGANKSSWAILICLRTWTRLSNKEGNHTFSLFCTKWSIVRDDQMRELKPGWSWPLSFASLGIKISFSTALRLSTACTVHVDQLAEIKKGHINIKGQNITNEAGSPLPW